MTQPIKTGDTVKHLPTGERWLIAWADEREVSACGWPETIAQASDCELIKSCSAEESLSLLKQIAQGISASYRRARVREILAKKTEEAA